MIGLSGAFALSSVGCPLGGPRLRIDQRDRTPPSPEGHARSRILTPLLCQWPYCDKSIMPKEEEKISPMIPHSSKSVNMVQDYGWR